jgi:polar amino acid transport system ATP-binding protein
MVFQRFNLFPHMTVLENLIMAPINLHGVSRSQAVRWRKSCWRRWD